MVNDKEKKQEARRWCGRGPRRRTNFASNLERTSGGACRCGGTWPSTCACAWTKSCAIVGATTCSPTCLAVEGKRGAGNRCRKSPNCSSEGPGSCPNCNPEALTSAPGQRPGAFHVPGRETSLIGNCLSLKRVSIAPGEMHCQFQANHSGKSWSNQHCLEERLGANFLPETRPRGF